MIYPWSVIYTPKWILTKYKELIVKFIWDDTPPKVKYSAITSDIPNRGLKRQNLETKVKSLHHQWIQNINKTTYKAAWKEYVATKLVKNHSTEAIVEYNMQYKDYPSYMDKFYNNIFKTWAKLHNRQPTTGEQVVRDNIWNNSFIHVDQKTLYYKNWMEKGIYKRLTKPARRHYD